MKKSVLSMIAATTIVALAFVACQKKEQAPAPAPAPAVQKPMTSKTAEPKVPETPIKLGGH